MFMQRTTSATAGNGLHTTIKYMRGAASIGLGDTIERLRRTTSGAAGNGLGATMRYLRRTTSAATNNGLSTTTDHPCSEAPFEINSEPHTGARPSVRLCVGPELARCVHSLAGAQVACCLLAASPTQTKHLAGGVACHVCAMKTWAARMRSYRLRYNSGLMCTST
jgi:hypothetical protein